MAVTIVLTNQKGGVGKTTTTNAIVAGLSKRRKKVLSIDLDPQGNLGFSLGVDIEEGLTIYEVLKGEIGIRSAIRSTENYGDIITSNILLSEAMLSLQKEESQLLLNDALLEVADEYDYIIIDTPPALNLLTLNGYVAADYLIIPMAAEILSLVGLIQLKDTVEGIQASMNPKLKVLGILLTRYSARTNLSRDVKEMADTVAAQIGTTTFETAIRTGVAVGEAPAHGKSVMEYAPRSNPAKDYRSFIAEVLRRI